MEKNDESVLKTVDDVQEDMKLFIEGIFSTFRDLYETPDVNLLIGATNKAHNILETYEKVFYTIEHLKGISKSESQQLNEIENLQKKLLDKRKRIQQVERELYDLKDEVEKHIFQVYK